MGKYFYLLGTLVVGERAEGVVILLVKWVRRDCAFTRAEVCLPLACRWPVVGLSLDMTAVQIWIWANSVAQWGRYRALPACSQLGCLRLVAPP